MNEHVEESTSSARRFQILDAVGRITLRGGLGSATFRSIAEEAGVSVRLVQYYFGNRQQLLLAVQTHVAEKSTERLIQRATDTDGSPRASLSAILGSFIPTDDVSRVAMLTYSALHNTWLADGETPDDAYVIPRLGEATIAEHLGRAELAEGVDIETESMLLMSLVTGLSLYVLDGMHTPEAALDVIEHQLRRLFA